MAPQGVASPLACWRSSQLSNTAVRPARTALADADRQRRLMNKSKEQRRQREQSHRLRSLTSAADVLAEVWAQRDALHLRQLATAMHQMALQLANSPAYVRLSFLAAPEYDLLLALVARRLGHLGSPLHATFRVLATLSWSVVKLRHPWQRGVDFSAAERDLFAAVLRLLDDRMALAAAAEAAAGADGTAAPRHHGINTGALGTSLRPDVLTRLAWSVAKAAPQPLRSSLDPVQRGLLLWSLANTRTAHPQLLAGLRDDLRVELCGKQPPQPFATSMAVWSLVTLRVDGVEAFLEAVAPAIRTTAAAGDHEAVNMLWSVCKVGTVNAVAEDDLVMDLCDQVRGRVPALSRPLLSHAFTAVRAYRARRGRDNGAVEALGDDVRGRLFAKPQQQSS